MQSFQFLKRGRRAILAGSVAAALLILSSCGEPQLGSIAGKVSYRGEPILGPGLNVTFYQKGRGSGDSMSLSDTGTFASASPVDTGVYNVYFNEVPVTLLPRSQRAKGAAAQRPSIPMKYFDMSTSGLSFEVKPGKNEFLIELQDPKGDSSGAKSSK